LKRDLDSHGVDPAVDRERIGCLIGQLSWWLREPADHFPEKFDDWPGEHGVEYAPLLIVIQRVTVSG
jgi:hypothetical protein